MTAISTFANYRSAPRITNYQDATAPTSTATTSFTRMGGSTTAAASTPGTVYSSDASATFSMIDLSGTHKYLSEFMWHFIGNSVATSVYLIDKLVAVNTAVTTTGSKTINSSALTRYTDGNDVQVWLEITTAGTTTIPVIQLESYTDQSGNPSAVGPVTLSAASATSAAGNWIGPFGLASGDYGVKSVQSINVNTAAGGSCAMNVVLAKTLAVYGSNDSIVRAYNRPYWVPGPRIYDGATLTLLHRATNASEQGEYGFTIALAE